MHFLGVTNKCEQEPNWARIYAVIAKPDDDESVKAEAAERIKGLKPKCQKVLMNPTACHGCEFNPIKADEDIDREAYMRHARRIGTIARMVDASAMGLLRLDDILDLEFEQMRTYLALKPGRF